jgi:hypothetical protein
MQEEFAVVVGVARHAGRIRQITISGAGGLLASRNSSSTGDPISGNMSYQKSKTSPAFAS